MKRILLVSVCIFAFISLQAQAPQSFSYKALIKNQYGLPVVNKSVSIQISIIHGNISGLAVYIENHKITTSLLGTVDIEIGRGTSILGLFDAIDWSQSPYFVKSEVDIKGGTNYQLIAITELLSVPYALFAGNAANGFSGNYNDLENKPTIPTNLSELNNDVGYINTETDPEFNNALVKGITETDTANWNSKSNFNGDYTALSNKPFIPTKTSDLENNSGFITVEADGSPTNELQVLSISNDTIFLSQGGFVKLSLNSNAWNLDAGNKNVINIANPINNNDAVNKGYIDHLLMTIGATGKLLNAGFSVKQLLDEGHTVENLLQENVSISDLINAGAGLNDLYNESIGVGMLEQNGASEENLINANLIGYISDYDGNNYKWVKIGNQSWMAQDLRCSHYADGTEIDDYYKPDESIDNGLYGYYYSSVSTLKGENGNTNYEVRDIQGACPKGWHVPNFKEWQKLANSLGGANSAGGKLKEADTAHWQNPNTGATNESGFGGLPSGIYYYNQLSGIGSFVAYWTSTIYYNKYYYNRVLYNSNVSLAENTTEVYGYPEPKMCIRCIKNDLTNDGDNDGFSENEGDCDDTNSTIFPDAPELFSDGIDQDCDGYDDIDSDGDGYSVDQGDCNDINSNIHPSAKEICADEIDQNCDGLVLSCDDLEGRIKNNESVVDLLLYGFTLNDLFNAGVGVGTFEKSGITAQQLEEEGFIGTVTDIDGNNYKWVRIGNQYWMAENLRTSSYNDGTKINKITDNSEWLQANAAYCWYNNDSISYSSDYGALYNYYAVESGNLCPSGWHIPSGSSSDFESDWYILLEHLGDSASYKLVFDDQSTNNSSIINSSGFSARMGGYREGSYGGYFGIMNNNGLYWTAYDVVGMHIFPGGTLFKQYSPYKANGFSVKCIKD